MMEILKNFKFDADLRRANDTCARTQQRVAAISREKEEICEVAKTARTLQASMQKIAAKLNMDKMTRSIPKLQEKVKIDTNRTLSAITVASTLLNKQMSDVTQKTVGDGQKKDDNIRQIEADMSTRKDSLDELDLHEKISQLKGHLQARLRNQLRVYEQLQSLHTDESSIDIGINTIGAAMKTLGCGSSPEHSKVSVHIPRAIQGRKRQFFITTLDETDHVFDLFSEDVKVRLRHKETGNIVEATVEYVAESKHYCATLTPQHLGGHELIVTVQNMPLRGSPFHIWVRKWREWTQLPSSASQFLSSSVMGGDRVHGLAMHANGNLYVAQAKYVRIIDPRIGTTIAKIGENRNINAGALAIAIHGDHLYIAITEHDARVQVICALHHEGYANLYHWNIIAGRYSIILTGICVDPYGTAYISDFHNHRIVVQESNRRISREIKDPQVKYPHSITFDPHGNLHVISYGVPLVAIFTPDGRHLQSYGDKILMYPVAIAIDEEGYSFVVDHNDNLRFQECNLQVFNPQHELIKTIRIFVNDFCNSIVIVHDGNILIGERDNCCIYKI